MKFAHYILLFVCTINYVFSQDTLFFLNKTTLPVKVKEIGVNQVKYSRFDNPGGPIYVTAKNELQYIKFQNGGIDTIKSVTPPLTTPKKMSFVDGKLYYSDRTLNDERLLMLIMKEQAPKQKLLLEKYGSMRSHKKKQQLFFFGGVGVGVALMGISEAIISELVESNTPFIIGVATGAAISATGIILSIKNRRARLRDKNDIADLYNNP